MCSSNPGGRYLQPFESSSGGDVEVCGVAGCGGGLLILHTMHKSTTIPTATLCIVLASSSTSSMLCNRPPGSRRLCQLTMIPFG